MSGNPRLQAADQAVKPINEQSNGGMMKKAYVYFLLLTASAPAFANLRIYCTQNSTAVDLQQTGDSTFTAHIVRPSGNDSIADLTCTVDLRADARLSVADCAQDKPES